MRMASSDRVDGIFLDPTEVWRITEIIGGIPETDGILFATVAKHELKTGAYVLIFCSHLGLCSGMKEWVTQALSCRIHRM